MNRRLLAKGYITEKDLKSEGQDEDKPKLTDLIKEDEELKASQNNLPFLYIQEETDRYCIPITGLFIFWQSIY